MFYGFCESKYDMQASRILEFAAEEKQKILNVRKNNQKFMKIVLIAVI